MKKIKLLVILGYICAISAILFETPLFMIFGFIIGIINISKDEAAHGLFQIVLSISLGVCSMSIGTIF